MPLSPLGEQQAQALGRWFAAFPTWERPEIARSSPYLRAQATAELVCLAGGLAPRAPPRVVDERLREREFGVLDRLTSAGISQLYPEQPALMGIDAEGEVANCGVTEYRFNPAVPPDGALELARYNFTAPLEQAGAPVTSAPDAPVAVR